MIEHYTSTKEDGNMRPESSRIDFIAKQFPKADGCVFPSLQHGSSIVEQHGIGQTARPECDGLITRVPNLVLTVNHADCFPVSFISQDSKKIGIAHCGWRGIAGGLPEKMAAHFPNGKVIIGPGICTACFVVNEDVVDIFGGKSNAIYNKLTLRYHISLAQMIKNQVRKHDIIVIDESPCVSCNMNYFSHRRDKTEPIELNLSAISIIN